MLWRDVRRADFRHGSRAQNPWERERRTLAPPLQPLPNMILFSKKYTTLIAVLALAGACSSGSESAEQASSSGDEVTATMVQEDSLQDMPVDGVDERTTGNEPARVAVGTEPRDGFLPMIQVTPSRLSDDAVANSAARTQAGREPSQNNQLSIEDICAEPNVYFSIDSAELTPTAQTRLGALAECLRDANVEEVTLTGHADGSGTEQYNMELSRERARVVEDFLQNAGITTVSYDVEAHGEAHARAERSAVDRRTDVELAN